MTNPPILLYDHACGVCHWLVRFVLRHDRLARFRFAGLDSPTGRALRLAHRVDPSLDSVVLVDGGSALVRSDAVIQVLRRLGWPWRIGAGMVVLPRRWRDAGYDALAARRALLASGFGLTCRGATLEESTRFLDRDDAPAAPDPG